MTEDPAVWLKLISEVRAYRSTLYFSRRELFDRALLPITSSGYTLVYPAAFYHITEEDFLRAKACVELSIPVKRSNQP